MKESNKETHTPFTSEVLSSLGIFEQDVLFLIGTSTEPVKTADIRKDLLRVEEDKKLYADAVNNLINQGLLIGAETEDGKKIVTSREDVQEYFEILEGE